MQSSFSEAIAKLKEAIGAPHVLTSDEEIKRRSKDTSPWLKTCSAVVYPGSTEEVARVLRIAGDSKLTVWPYSKGKNWGYGASMGFRDGELILMLERMNNILEVNEELAYAVIEPGVTQRQLDQCLKERKLKLWTDCTDSTPEGSVIGNALERGVGYTKYCDHFAHLCGLEVVLANGDIVRTGGGPKNSRTWHTHKWGTGPFLDGLFSQSNLGVVTKAGIWLMPEPEAVNCFVCEVEDARDQPDVMDTLRHLSLDGVLQSNSHFSNDILFMALMIPYPYDLVGSQRSLSMEARATLRQRYAVAPWSFTGAIYGTRAQVRLHRRLIKRALSRFGMITFIDNRKFALIQSIRRFWKKARSLPLVPSALRRLTGASLEKLEVISSVYPVVKGTPGEYIVSFAHFKSRGERRRVDVDPGRDGAGLIWLALISPLTGEDTRHLLEICEPLFERHGLDMAVSFITVNPRSALILMPIFYDKENADETARALALYDELTSATVAAGFQQYRTSVAFGDRIFAAAPEFQKLANTIKRAVDPQTILSPGRYGMGLPSSAS